jgi:L-asparaginase
MDALHHGPGVRIFVTGGTFDKEYDEIHGRLAFKDSNLPKMLRLGRCRLAVSIRTLMMVDSLDMTDADRALIVQHCGASEEPHIVITHGTDTMVETAKALAAAAIPDKTIVLTGAMIPFAFGSSDGLFNLGSALSFVQVLPPGVYVAMNGRCFAWDRVRKNRQTGMFEEVLGHEHGHDGSRATPSPGGPGHAHPRSAAPQGEGPRG